MNSCHNYLEVFGRFEVEQTLRLTHSNSRIGLFQAAANFGANRLQQNFNKIAVRLRGDIWLGQEELEKNFKILQKNR